LQGSGTDFPLGPGCAGIGAAPAGGTARAGAADSFLVVPTANPHRRGEIYRERNQIH
jgi:hypothetical protein